MIAASVVHTSPALAQIASAAPSLSDAADAPPPWLVTTTPTSVRLGVDRTARIEIHGPDVPATAVDLRASVGVIRDVVRTGRGSFTARYEPPASRAPDVALIVARSTGFEVPGVVALPLAGRYRLSVTVEPAARVRVELGDGTTQDAVAPASGAFDLTMHVAPGIDRARIVATDRSGNSSEHIEQLDLPPLHRVMLWRVPAVSSSAASRVVRWFVVASLPGGALADNAPESIEVIGALGTITRRARGVFEIVTSPPRRAEASTVSVQVREHGVALSPDQDDAVVSASRPVRIRWGLIGTVRAGESVTLGMTVEDAEGAPISGLQESIAVHVDDRELRPRAAGELYALTLTAPERAGTHELFAQLSLDGDWPIEARTSLTVHAAPPERFVVRGSLVLRVDVEREVTFATLDRFGNPSIVGHPVVSGVGAAVTRARVTSDGLAIAIIPRTTAIRLDVRGDYEFHDSANFVAAMPPMRHFAISLLATLRTNLGAALIGGGRVSMGGQLLLGHNWEGLGLVDMGLEATQSDDGHGTTATVISVPVIARLGAVRRLGPLRLGAVLGGGLRAVDAATHTVEGTNLEQSQLVPAFTGALMLRWLSPGGLFTLEIGGETGWLDTAPVHGTIGGAYAALGWGVVL